MVLLTQDLLCPLPLQIFECPTRVTILIPETAFMPFPHESPHFTCKIPSVFQGPVHMSFVHRAVPALPTRMFMLPVNTLAPFVCLVFLPLPPSSRQFRKWGAREPRGFKTQERGKWKEGKEKQNNFPSEFLL